MLKVLTPSTSNALISLAGIRKDAEFRGGSDDDDLANLIEEASAAIASACGRKFVRETFRETFAASSLTSDELMLSRWPVARVVALRINGETLDASRVLVEDDAGIVRLLTPLGALRAWYGVSAEIEYEAGYSSDDDDGLTLPADLRRACIMLVQSIASGRGRDMRLRGESVEGIGSHQYQVASAAVLPFEVEALLKPYRVLRVG